MVPPDRVSGVPGPEENIDPRIGTRVPCSFSFPVLYGWLEPRGSGILALHRYISFLFVSRLGRRIDWNIVGNQ